MNIDGISAPLAAGVAIRGADGRLYHIRADDLAQYEVTEPAYQQQISSLIDASGLSTIDAEPVSTTPAVPLDSAWITSSPS